MLPDVLYAHMMPTVSKVKEPSLTWKYRQGQFWSQEEKKKKTTIKDAAERHKDGFMGWIGTCE